MKKNRDPLNYSHIDESIHLQIYVLLSIAVWKVVVFITEISQLMIHGL